MTATVQLGCLESGTGRVRVGNCSRLGSLQPRTAAVPGFSGKSRSWPLLGRSLLDAGQCSDGSTSVAPNTVAISPLKDDLPLHCGNQQPSTETSSWAGASSPRPVGCPLALVQKVDIHEVVV